MHEFHIVEKFVREAVKKSEENNKEAISQIHVSFSESSGLASESIKLYFQTFCEDEPKLHNCELFVNRIKTRLHCPGCNSEFAYENKSFSCPKCNAQGQLVKVSSEIKIEKIIFKP